MLLKIEKCNSSDFICLIFALAKLAVTLRRVAFFHKSEIEVMRNAVIVLLAVVGLAGCVSSGTSGSQTTAKPAVATAQATPVTKPKAGKATNETVEMCWKSAGMKGDLYKFISVEEAKNTLAIFGATDEQLASFKSCMKGA